MDEISASILQNQLNVICEEMGIIMTKTAQSPIFSESHDFSCYLTGADGYVVSHADGIPIHTGSGGFAVRHCLEYWQGEIEPGDMFILNDPYMASGNHLPDWTLIAPVHLDGRLVGFACNRAHQIDIGGRRMGSYDSDVHEIHEEGTRLPPLKLFEGGELRKDVWDLLLLNTRVPDTVSGDLEAMVGSCRIGARRLEALANEYGEELVAGFEALLDHGERSMRAAIEALPDGRYEAEEVMNNDVFERKEVAIRIAIEVRGSELVVDFAGTAEQTPGYKNSPYTNTCSAVYLGLQTVLTEVAPANEGAFRMITVKAPEGSIVNPRYPAAVTLCTVHPAHEIIHACWRALAPVLPERVSAGWGRSSYPVTSGSDASGSRYAAFHWGAQAGVGATARRDGFYQCHLMSLGILKVPSLELYERLYPMHFLRHSIRTDGAGPGYNRGGTGVEYVVAVERDAWWSLRGEGLYTPSGFGTVAGKAGREAELTFRDLASGEVIPNPQYGALNLPPVVMELHSAGGGGWGDPFTREPERVLEDVRGGVVSVEAAEREYGVVIDPKALAVDEEATRSRRATAGNAMQKARIR